ncbi:MAG: DMT family transporter [Clostridiales bacterium]|nr:DMT family transporter [Candidatus Crickella equi]
MTRKQALIAVNVATLLLGTTGLFGRWISISSIGITFGRVVLSSIALFAFCKYKGQDISIKSKKDGGLFLVSGVLLAIHWITFFQSVKLSSVAICTITFATFPLFLTFLEPIVFKTKLTLRNVMFAALVVVGISITAWGTDVGSGNFMGFVMGFASAISYAFLQLFNKRFTIQGYNGMVISMYEQAMVAVVLLPVIIASGFHPTTTDILLLIALGLFCTAIAHTTLISSMKAIPAQLVGICNSMETVYSIALAFVLLGEVPTINEIIGAIIVTIVVVSAQLQKE